MKKIFTIIFSLIFVLSNVFSSLVVFAQEESVQIQQYNTKARDLLVALSIVTEMQVADGTESKNVTRGEFADVLTKLSIYPEGGTLDVVTYDDVDESCEYYAGISSVYALGLMKGYGDNTFRPDNGITFGEISKVLIRLLGYESVIAKANYNAYSTAVTLKLFQGLKGTRNKDTIVNRAEMVQVIFNAIHTDLMEPSYGTKGTYELSKGCSILTEYFDVYWNKGVVSKNEITALGDISASCAPERCVGIDGINYMVGNTDASDLLGYRVEYYYKVNVNGISDRELIYVSEEGLNEVLVINSKDLITPVTDVKTVKYYDGNERVKTQSIPSTAFFLYNGVPASLTSENITVDLGEIIFINNGTGSKWSVVKVESYETVVVETIDTSNGIVFSKYLDTTPLNGIKDGLSNFTYNPDEVNKTVFFYDSVGNPSEPQVITEWDILHIKRDRNNKRTCVYSLVIEKGGTVTAKKGDDIVFVDEDEYEVAPWVLNQKPSIMPKLGENFMFYLDSAGRIAAIREMGVDEFSFAYFIDGAVNRSSNTYEIKICDDNGTVAIKECASTMIVDGVRKKKPEEQEIAIDSVITDYITRLIQIRYNADGLVKEIKTISGGEFLHQDYTGVFYPLASSLGGKIAVDASTVHFYVPTDDDESMYYTRKGISHLVSGSTYTARYSKFAYRFVDELKVAAFVHLAVPYDIFADSYFTACHHGDATYLVDDIRYAYDENLDMYIPEVSVWDKGTMSLLRVRAKNVMTHVSPAMNYYSSNNLDEQIFTNYDSSNPPNFQLGKGDVIKVKTDHLGYVTRIEVIYDYDEDRMFIQSKSKPYQSTTGNYDSYYRMLMGYVNKRDSGFFQLACTEGDVSTVPSAVENVSQIEVMKENSAIVTVYDSYTEEVYKGTMADIFTYEATAENASRIIVEVNRGVPQRIFVYR